MVVRRLLRPRANTGESEQIAKSLTPRSLGRLVFGAHTRLRTTMFRIPLPR